MLPSDVFIISVEQRTPGNLDPDEWAILRRVFDLIKQNANGAELGPLRADQAKLIEADEGGAAEGAPTTAPVDR